MGEELTIIRRPVAASAPTMRDLFAVLFRQRRLGLISFMTIFLAQSFTACSRPRTSLT